MRLYTICIDQRSVLVMSAVTDLPAEEFAVKDPVLLKAMRDQAALLEQMSAAQPDLEDATGRREIDEALDGWLGADLRSMKSGGLPLWNGNHDRMMVRNAEPEEEAQWRQSWQNAISTGELDAGEESWLTFLVPVAD